MTEEKKREPLSFTETEKFIQFYLGQEVLWNVKHKDYSKKPHRQAAVNMIAEQMKAHGREMTVEQVTSKIANIRTYYSRELKKLNASQKSGASAIDIYKPVWEFFSILDPFLRCHIQQRASLNNMTTESENQVIQQASCSTDGGHTEPSSEQEIDECDSISGTQDTCSIPPKKKKIRRNDSDTSSSTIQAKLCSALDSFTQRHNDRLSDPDILFGKQIGLELKQISDLRKRQELKLKIHQLVMQYQFSEE